MMQTDLVDESNSFKSYKTTLYPSKGKQIDNYIEKVKKTSCVLTSDLHVDVGKTPYEVCVDEPLYRLLHYRPLVGKPYRIPILIIYALLNKSYILDLQDDKSLVKNLLTQGFDIYLIDWKAAKYVHKFVSLSDYINYYINHCIDVIRKKNLVDRITLFGYCMGSTLSVIYSAIHPQKVKNLVTISPIIDTDDNSLLTNLSKNINIEKLLDIKGNLPPEFLYALYLSLKPFKQGVNKYLTLIDKINDHNFVQNFLRVEGWLYDAPPIAGEFFRQWIKDIYQNNLLVKKQMKIDETIVNLSYIEMPLLNVIAEDDHLVSPHSSVALEKHVNSRDYTLLKFPIGHVGLIASRYSQTNVLPKIGEWLKLRSDI